MFCALGHVIGCSEGVGSSFMFCAPELMFDDTEGADESSFHVLRSRICFLWYHGR
jgi:hypothetical protein